MKQTRRAFAAAASAGVTAFVAGQASAQDRQQEARSPRLGTDVYYVLREGVERSARVVRPNAFGVGPEDLEPRDAVDLLVFLDGPDDNPNGLEGPLILFRGYVHHDPAGAVGTWHRIRE